MDKKKNLNDNSKDKLFLLFLEAIKDNYFIRVHQVVGGEGDKYTTVWGFDVLGINLKASSTIFTPHLWSSPSYCGRWVQIPHRKPYKTYEQALQKGVEYYRKMIGGRNNY